VKDHVREPENESMPDQEAAFTARARELLLDSAERLDGQTRSRLTQARHAALAQAGEGGRSFQHWLLPAGSVAAAAFAAFLWLGPTPPDATLVQAASSPIDDIELMAGVENFELIEDLDFYAWLDSEAVLPGGETG
jgi:hypothetical protein